MNLSILLLVAAAFQAVPEGPLLPRPPAPPAPAWPDARVGFTGVQARFPGKSWGPAKGLGFFAQIGMTGSTGIELGGSAVSLGASEGALLGPSAEFLWAGCSTDLGSVDLGLIDLTFQASAGASILRLPPDPDSGEDSDSTPSVYLAMTSDISLFGPMSLVVRGSLTFAEISVLPGADRDWPVETLEVAVGIAF